MSNEKNREQKSSDANAHERPYKLSYPHPPAEPELTETAPTTVAPPISGELIVTANNRPDDPRSWQNEPGPGADQPAEDEVVRLPDKTMEKVAKVSVPELTDDKLPQAPRKHKDVA